jgi:hypothetical protein
MRRYIIGMLVGWALWAVLYAIGYGYLTGRSFLPGPVGFVVALASMPIGFGGWVYVWGDGGGPAFALSIWFSVMVGLLLYGALGLAVGAIISRLRKRSAL